MKKYLALFVALIAGLALAMSAITAQAQSSSTFAPTHDSWVGVKAPTTTHGTATLLGVRGTGTDEQWSYFQFNPTVSGTATLKIKMGSIWTPGTLSIFSTTSGWTEGALTWNNKPLPSPATALDSQPLVSGAPVMTFNVGTVPAGPVSFIIKNSNSSKASLIYSKEQSGTTEDPVLTVSGTAPTTTTVAPTTTTLPPSGFDNEYLVNKTGVDTNPCTPSAACLTIQRAVDVAVASTGTDLIRVEPGVYREKVTVPSGTTAMKIEGTAAGVYVSGSEVVSSWTSYDASKWYTTWTNNWGVQAWPSGWPVVGNDILRRRELVFVDGVWMHQKLSLAAVVDGSFYVDEAADRLYLDPPGASMGTTTEIAQRDAAMVVSSRSNFTLRNITFQHAATPMQSAGLQVSGGADNLVEDVTSRLNSWGGLSVSGNRATLRRVDTSYNGVIGYGSYDADNQSWYDGISSWNGEDKRAEDAAMEQWEQGAGKVLLVRTHLMQGYTTEHNYGPGPWWDTDNTNVTVRNLHSAYNSDTAVFFEFSQGPLLLETSKIAFNFRGPSCQHCANLTVQNNTIFKNGIEMGFSSWNAPAVLTPHDGGANIDLSAPNNVTFQNNQVQISDTSADKWFNSAPHLFSYAETWRTTYTTNGNSYYSTVNGTPFVRRNSDNSQNPVNFTDWKTYLGGSRDSTSTFATTDPGFVYP